QNQDRWTGILIRKAIERCFHNGHLSKNGFYDSEGFISLATKFVMNVKSANGEKRILEEQNPSLTPFCNVLEEYLLCQKEYGIQDRYDGQSPKKEGKCYDWIIIDGFYNFRPKEWEILTSWTKNPLEIYFRLPKDYDNQVFQETITKLEDFSPIHQELSTNEQNLGSIFFKDESSLSLNSTFVKAPDPILETRYLIQEILCSKTSFDEMMIVCPDNYEMILSFFLKKYDIPSNITYGRNIKELPIIKQWISLLEKKDIKNQFLTLFNIDHIFPVEENTSIQKLRNQFQGKDFEEIEDLTVLRSFQETLLEDRASYEFFHRCLDFLKKMEEPVEILQYILQSLDEYHEEDFLKEEMINDCRTFLKSLLDKEEIISYPKESFPSYIIHLFDTYQVDYKKGGVLVSSLDELRHIPRKKIYYLGFHEDNYPKTISQNVLHKDSVIKLLKEKEIPIMSFDEYRAMEQLYFLLSLSQGEEFYFSMATQDDKLPSFYLTEIRDKTNLQEKEYSLKEYFDPKVILDPHDESLKKAWRREEEGKKIVNFESLKWREEERVLENDLLQDFIQQKKSYHPSELNSYLRCPLQYYYRYVCKFTWGEGSILFELGKILHRAMENFYKFYQEDIQEAISHNYWDFKEKKEFIHKILYHQMEGIITEKQREDYSKIYSDSLMQAVINDIKDIQKKSKRFFPKYYEKRFQFTTKNNIHIVGQMDRIDQSSDGDWLITDYKLNNGAKYGDFEREKTIQLPIYYLYQPERTLGLRYLLLRKGEIMTFSDPCPEDLEERSLELLETTTNKIKEGKFFTASEDVVICRYCEFRSFCRKRCF
ncbi:MAG: PD-(D/E)XK nuclease family protein, partial [Tissierellia bacterium]|nr:PD-(D/E)XK nuclease family protein [Tissierellia bacterium]